MLISNRFQARWIMCDWPASDQDLMHRDGTIIADASLPVPQQAGVDAHHMLIVGVGEGLVRQFDSLIEKALEMMFGHRSIVGQCGGGGHSYFPRVAMTSCSLFLPSSVFTRAYEFSARGRI